MTTPYTIGIDVSKAKLDVYVSGLEQWRQSAAYLSQRLNAMS